MNLKLIEDRFIKYSLKTKQDEKNALKEITQEIALSALARTDFFKHAAFIGGSCLRIAHGLPRFSEDLDFWTLRPSPDFKWEYYLKVVEEEFRAFGFHMRIEDRGQADAKIKRAFLKQDSIGKVLILSHARNYTENEILLIKFEIDTHPPAGSEYESRNLDFPYPFVFTSLDKPSLFASKIAALFDRNKEKGRHWFDFLWYIVHKWSINYTLLGHALKQEVSLPWLQQVLAEIIRSSNWADLRDDVRKFISLEEQESLDLWGPQFFLGHLEALIEYMQPKQISIASLIANEKGKCLLELVKEALASGAQVNDDTRNGHRPLQMALIKGHIEIARLLIEQGADPNYRDRSGLTPLQAAINHGHFELAKLLIKEGAAFDPHAPNLAFDYQKLYLFIQGR
jgi:hypothetical protein